MAKRKNVQNQYQASFSAEKTTSENPDKVLRPRLMLDNDGVDAIVKLEEPQSPTMQEIVKTVLVFTVSTPYG